VEPKPWIGDVLSAPACIGSAGGRAEIYKKRREVVQSIAPTALRATMSAQAERDHPDLLVESVRALEGGGAAAEAEAARWRGWLWERHADVPSVRVLRADDLARLGRWAEVREALAPCTGTSFPENEDHLKHLFHLRALASLHLGDAEEAVRWLRDAAAHHGPCDLTALAALLRPKPSPGDAGAEDAPPSGLPLTELVWAVHAADACLDGGDPEGALAALDPRRFDTRDEVQVLARRAEAWLRLAPTSGPRRFTKIVTLAALVEAHAGLPWAKRKEMPIPGATWDRARLDDLVRRASAWLDALGELRGGEP
jgi:hypothetical protein